MGRARVSLLDESTRREVCRCQISTASSRPSRNNPFRWRRHPRPAQGLPPRPPLRPVRRRQSRRDDRGGAQALEPGRTRGPADQRDRCGQRLAVLALIAADACSSSRPSKAAVRPVIGQLHLSREYFGAPSSASQHLHSSCRTGHHDQVSAAAESRPTLAVATSAQHTGTFHLDLWGKQRWSAGCRRPRLR